MAELIRCKCGATWTGVARAHCTADDCHQTFGGVTSFDQHRIANAGRGKCKDPAKMGLIQTEKGVWSVPQQED